MDSFFDFALIQLESFLIFADKEPQLKFRLMLKKVFLRVDLDSGLLNWLGFFWEIGVDGSGFYFWGHELLL